MIAIKILISILMILGYFNWKITTRGGHKIETDLPGIAASILVWVFLF